MGKCPTCNKEVYFAERQPFNNKDFHKTCFKCTKCGKKLTPGKISEHDGQLYCPHPCYADLFGPHGKK